LIFELKLKGKKLGILGDSISTYSGFNPSGYATFYPRNTVINVEMTWWKQLLRETGMEICVNASWSGSTICGDTTRADGYVGCSDARVNALTDGQGNKPDIIIVWMGINDFGKANGITCGSYDGTTAVSTATNITAITEAYGVLLKKLENKYPNAQIFVCRILPEQFASEMSASYANGFPNINPNDNISLPELNDHIEKIANAFGCGVIPMDKCGATFFNINTYTGDGLHPNALLAPKMCEVAKQTLLSLVN
jgi:lysophospholipase L1-like esterase